MQESGKMKCFAVTFISIFIYVIIMPTNSNAHTPFGDTFDYLDSNHIYKDESMTDPFKKEVAVTKFVSIPAKCGVIMGAMPGWICGGAIGGVISLVYLPFHVTLKLRGPPIYTTTIIIIFLGADLLGRPTSFLGEILVGTPFYFAQAVFYDLPRTILN